MLKNEEKNRNNGLNLRNLFSFHFSNILWGYLRLHHVEKMLAKGLLPDQYGRRLSRPDVQTMQTASVWLDIWPTSNLWAPDTGANVHGTGRPDRKPTSPDVSVLLGLFIVSYSLIYLYLSLTFYVCTGRLWPHWYFLLPFYFVKCTVLHRGSLSPCTAQFQ